jgi:ABC-type transport system involved in multi-copper enzyme maturation permease subunit
MLLTLAVYAVGCSTEKVKFFVESVIGADKVAPSLKFFSKIIYYLFPNFSLFDLKSQVIYGLPVDGRSIILTVVYGFGYAIVMLAFASFAFRKRDFL